MRGSHHRIQLSRPAPSAFTLIELLVTVAILGVLVGVILPGLSGSRSFAKQARELAAAQQLSTAYSLYADEHRGTLMPGYATGQMVASSPMPGQSTLTVLDEDNQPLTGVLAQRYPWRLYPYLDSNFAGIYLDQRMLERYRHSADYQYFISLSPSLGLNSTFCGGDADRFGFNPQALAAWGSFYVTNAGQPSFPSRLIVFASARGLDPDSSDSTPVPGFFRVDSPYRLNRMWAPHFDPAAAPSAFGHVDLRYSGRAITAAFDGHAQSLSEAELQDMRRWADRAMRADWTLGGGN